MPSRGRLKRGMKGCRRLEGASFQLPLGVEELSIGDDAGGWVGKEAVAGEDLTWAKAAGGVSPKGCTDVEAGEKERDFLSKQEGRARLSWAADGVEERAANKTGEIQGVRECSERTTRERRNSLEPERSHGASVQCRSSALNT